MATLTKYPTANTPTTGFNGVANNPTNAYTDDTVYANFQPSKPRNDEDAHSWGGFDFSAIPAGSTINSVTVKVQEYMSASNSVGQWRVALFADITSAGALAPGVTTAIGGVQYTRATTDTSEFEWDLGTLSTEPTLAQLQGTNFGVRIEAAHGNTGTSYTYYVDTIEITVDYTEAAPAVAQRWFCFYEDSLENAGDTARHGGVNRGKALADDTVYLLRMGMSASGSISVTPKLQYRLKTTAAGGYGAWTDVNASSSYVRSAATANIDDDAQTTEQLEDSGTFTPGRFDEVDGAITTATSLTATNDTEFLFAIKARSAELSWRNIVQLRMVNASDGAAYDNYDLYPTLSLAGSIAEDFEDGTDLANIQALNDGSPNTVFDDVLLGEGFTFTDSPTPPHGSLASYGTADPTAVGSAQWLDVLCPELFVRYYIYKSATPTFNTGHVRFYDSGGTARNAIRWLPDGTLNIQENDSTNNSAGSPSTGQWVRVEARWVAAASADGSDSILELKYWDTDADSTGTPDGTVTVDPALGMAELGQFWLRWENTEDWYFDEVSIANDDWIGPVAGTVDGAAVLVGVGTVAAAGTVDPIDGAATLAGVGTVTASSPLTLPFTDDWTGTDSDPWDTTKWTLGHQVGSTAAIESNEGVLNVGAAYKDKIVMESNVEAIQDQSVLVYIDPITASSDEETWVFLRASTSYWTAEGIPTQCYMFWFETDATHHSGGIERVIASAYSSLPSYTTSRSSNAVPFWVRAEVEDSGSSVIVRLSAWDDGSSEPSTWDYEYEDTAPGVLLGATGILSLGAIDHATAATTVAFDNLVYDVPAAAPLDGAAVLLGTGALAGTGALDPPEGAASLVGVGTVAATGELAPPEGAVVLAGVGALAGAGEAVHDGAAPLSGVGTLTAAGVLVPPSGSALLAGAGAVVAVGVPLHDGAGSLAGVGTLTATADAVKVDGAATLTGVGTVAAAGVLAPPEGAATLTGAGAVTAAGQLVSPVGAAQLEGTGTATAAGQLVPPAGEVVLAGAGAVAATGGLVTPGAATLAGVGNLAALATVLAAGAAQLAGTGTLEAAGVLVPPTGAAELTGSGFIVATGEGESLGAAQLAGTGTVTAAGILVPPTGAAQLAGTGTVAAAGQLDTVEGAATLTGTGTVTAAAEGGAEGAAQLAGTGTVAAAGQLVPPEGAATLTGTGTLSAAAEGAVYGAAALGGAGTVTTNGGVAYSAVSVLAGVGTTETTGEAVYGADSALTGHGTVTSAAGANAYLAAVVLAGAGQLAAAGARAFVAAADLAGTGTVTVTSTSWYWRPAPTGYADAERSWTPRPSGYEPQTRE